MTISFDTMFVIFAIAAIWMVTRVGTGPTTASKTVEPVPPSRFERMGVPYCKALFLGWIAMMGMQAMLGASLGFGEAESIIVKLMTVMFLPVMVLFITPLVILYALILGRLPLPAGVAYILVGLLTGLTMQCQMALNGNTNLAAAFGQTSYAFDMHGLLVALTQPAAGAIGGFVFWRAMGYPGLKRGTARSLDIGSQTFDAMLSSSDTALDTRRAYGEGPSPSRRGRR